MTDDAMRWPLAERAADLARIGTLSAGAVTSDVILGLTQLSLRLDPALVARAPFALPTIPNTASEMHDTTVVWLGPDEWLVVGTEATLAATIRGALSGTHHAVVDVSANRAVIELRGSGRLGLLASRCSLDLHPRSWHAGMCAQTLLGRAQMILVERSDATWVLVRPSFGDYAVDVLLDGAATGH